MQKLVDLTVPTSANAPGVLAELWRTILRENNLVGFIPTLVGNYLEKNKNDNNHISVVKKKNRGTMYANISSREMSIKTFMDLNLNLLGCKDMTFQVTLTLPSGKKTTHSVKVTAAEINCANKELIDVINRATGEGTSNSSGEQHASAPGDPSKPK